MTPPASPAVRKAHEDTARTLLHVEAVGLHVLKGAVAQVGPGDPIVIARRSHEVVAATVLDIRKAARAQGALLFGAEITASGARIPLPDLDPPTDADRLSAERAARGYSDAILRQAQEWMAEHDAAQADPALRIEASYLESIAATETSEAFSDERTRIEKALAAENEESSWWPFLVKEWSADLEAAHRAKARGKKTKSGRAVSGPCDVCRGLHGTRIGWGSDWPGGHEPGKVHRHCRCISRFYAIPFEVTRKRAA